MYTPVLFAAQMELGWIRGITTCPSMNPYLQKNHQQSSPCRALTSIHPIPPDDMSCRAALRPTPHKGHQKFQPLSHGKSKNGSRGRVKAINGAEGGNFMEGSLRASFKKKIHERKVFAS